MTYYHLKKPEEVKRSLPNKAYMNLTLVTIEKNREPVPTSRRKESYLISDLS